MHKSPGDGHYLIHSVLFGLKSVGVTIEKQNIISALEYVTIAHCSKYMPFYVNPSFETLLCEMTDYLHHKHYDSSFGDIVCLFHYLVISDLFIRSTYTYFINRM